MNDDDKCIRCGEAVTVATGWIGARMFGRYCARCAALLGDREKKD